MQEMFKAGKFQKLRDNKEKANNVSTPSSFEELKTDEIRAKLA